MGRFFFFHLCFSHLRFVLLFLFFPPLLFFLFSGRAQLQKIHPHSQIRRYAFLVACYATLYPALSVRPSVGRSVGRSVGWLVGPHFTFFMFLRSLASLHLPKCFSNSNTAPAHPHATKVAVYPALLFVIGEFLSYCSF